MGRDADNAAHVSDKLHQPIEFVIVMRNDEGRIAAVSQK